LDRFQRDSGAVRVPHSTTFTCWDAYNAINKSGITLDDVVA
jgi:hypothetical protein